VGDHQGSDILEIRRDELTDLIELRCGPAGELGTAIVLLPGEIGDDQ